MHDQLLLHPDAEAVLGWGGGSEAQAALSKLSEGDQFCTYGLTMSVTSRIGLCWGCKKQVADEARA